MSQDNESHKSTRDGSPPTLVADELSQNKPQSNENDSNEISIDSFQNTLMNSLDEAIKFQRDFGKITLLTDTVEAIGSAASGTFANMRAGCFSDDTMQTKTCYDPHPGMDEELFHPHHGIDEAETLDTWDTKEEGAMMIQRLTSWNTLETAETYSFREMIHGLSISHKKKTVQFDYPPVQSMSEIPRPDPEDIPSLFFSEEELHQIHGDRFSTINADEVEVVISLDGTDDGDENEEVNKESNLEKGGIVAEKIDSAKSTWEDTESETEEEAKYCEITASRTELGDGDESAGHYPEQATEIFYNVKILSRSTGRHVEK